MNSKSSNRFLLLTSLLVLFLSLSVITGWFFNIPSLIQVSSEFVPMQFNTALCLCFCSLAGILSLYSKKNSAKVFAALPLMISSITLLQYLTGIDFKIDELFMDHYITVRSFYPGRMAPNTALCFILFSVNIFILHKKPASLTFYCIPISLVFAFSTMAFFGYISGLETSHIWGKMTEMALHTSVGFMVLSLGCLVYYWFETRKNKLVPEWSITMVFIGGITATIIYWQALVAQTQEDTRNELEIQTTLFINEIHADLKSQLTAIIKLYEDWQKGEKVNEDLFSEKTEFLFSTFKDLQAAYIIGNDGKTLWKFITENFKGSEKEFDPAGYFPDRSSKTAIGQPFTFNDQVYLTLSYPDSSDVQGNKILALVHFKTLIEQVKSHLNVKNIFALRFMLGDKVIYEDDNSELDGVIKISKNIAVGKENITLHAFTNADYLESAKSGIYGIFLLLGFTTTSLVSLILYFWRSLYDSREQLYKSQKELNDINRKLEFLVGDLTAKNADLEHFAYIASHDLQEPLRMVVNFSKLLKDEYQNKLDGDALKYINFSVEASLRMQKLISGLLEYAKLGSSKQLFEDTDFNQVVAEVKLNLKERLVETSAQITTDELPTVTFNKVQAIQLIQNLILNAVKYQEDGNVPLIKITAKENEDSWEMKVSDNGIGIPQNFHDKIFIPFKRLKRSEKFDGTGIGLSVCKKIVENHQGEITVESEVDVGTAFIMKFKKV
ncbi:MAG: ATP-binding protein [Lentisphaeraceae bacterium]|nr:ATP-binding protein [Lentisphaeraceae bacterium]